MALLHTFTFLTDYGLIECQLKKRLDRVVLVICVPTLSAFRELNQTDWSVRWKGSTPVEYYLGEAYKQQIDEYLQRLHQIRAFL